MPAFRSPQDMLIFELKQIHSAERQLSRALPRLAKRIDSERLREMLQQRQEQGASLIERIEDALEDMEVSKGRQKNPIADAFIEDLNDHVDDIRDDRMIDAFVLASVQKIEHYCIAAWGTAAAMGRLLGEDKIVKTMEQVLGEGKRFDDEMTRLAEDEINPRMTEEGEEDEDREEDEDKDEERSSSKNRQRARAKQH